MHYIYNVHNEPFPLQASTKNVVKLSFKFNFTLCIDCAVECIRVLLCSFELIFTSKNPCDTGGGHM